MSALKRNFLRVTSNRFIEEFLCRKEILPELEEILKQTSQDIELLDHNEEKRTFLTRKRLNYIIEDRPSIEEKKKLEAYLSEIKSVVENFLQASSSGHIPIGYCEGIMPLIKQMGPLWKRAYHLTKKLGFYWGIKQLVSSIIVDDQTIFYFIFNQTTGYHPLGYINIGSDIPFTPKVLFPSIAHEYAHHLQKVILRDYLRRPTSKREPNAIIEGHARGVQHNVAEYYGNMLGDQQFTFDTGDIMLGELKHIDFLIRKECCNEKQSSIYPFSQSSYDQVLLDLYQKTGKGDYHALGTAFFKILEGRYGREVYPAFLNPEKFLDITKLA